jgi:2-amino-4-hydroxy-6-hydroxymethyldihydropteridine diphosphokinase
MIYHLGLGSNLGSPAINLERARRLLASEGIVILRASALYRTEPVGFADQPWFLNQVLEVESELSPWEMLKTAKTIEKGMKRRAAPPNGPRVIDIDILLAGPAVVRSPSLSVPHPRLEERNFVLVPLAEIAAGAVHPVLKASIADLLRLSPDRSRVEKIEVRAKTGRRAGRGARSSPPAKKRPRSG